MYALYIYGSKMQSMLYQEKGICLLLYVITTYLIPTCSGTLLLEHVLKCAKEDGNIDNLYL